MSDEVTCNSCTVLIFASLGRDAKYIQSLLETSQINSQIVNSIPDLARNISTNTGAILLTSESIARQDLSLLIASLDAQPTWSDIPFIYLAPSRQSSLTNRATSVRNLLPENINNVMVLERPLSMESLISAVKWALSGRYRQFVIRDQLEELSRTSERLRISNERVDLALNSGAVLGTWVWDVQSDIVTGDDRLAKTFGLDVDSTIEGIPINDYIEAIHPEDKFFLEEAIAKSLINGGPYRAEYRIKSPEGIWKWIEANGYCELNEQGSPIRFPGILIDIDDRKKIERSLKQSESELRLVTDSIPVLIAFIDEEHRIRFINNASESWFYRSVPDLMGEFVDNLLEQRAGKQSVLLINDALRGEYIHRELSWPNMDGSKREAEVRYLPRMNSEGIIDGFHLFVMDITDRKIAEEIYHQSQVTLEKRVAERTRELQSAMEQRNIAEDALRQAQKMESVGQLTGGIAHDFNNLLQGITGSLNVIKKSIQLGKSIDVEKHVDNALSASFRAAGLTHRLLAFSRRQPLDPKAVQVNPLILMMEDLLIRTLGENIQIKLVLQDALWETLSDINQLESAILNLAINARDAMPHGGELTISTHNVIEKQFASNENAEFVKISVSDTGTGMSSDVIERAFDPFFTTKPQGQGTGLGLSMIYGFTRQSEGFCKIESELGIGTTLHIYLPRHILSQENDLIEEEQKLLTTPNLDGRVILVVEDDEIVRGLVVDFLKEIGFKVLEAKDGPSGLDILRTKINIDLLLTDIGLPGLNGRQIADAALINRNSLKVLFMTGYAETAASSSGFLREGMAMITKPFEMENLILKINQLI